MLFVVAGCDGNGSGLPTLSADAVAGAPALPTLPAADGQEECPEALLGPVVLQERRDTPDAPVVAVLEHGEAIDLVWAREFAAEFGPLTIRDSAGNVVAQEGDEVVLTGGSMPDDRFFVCRITGGPPQ